MNILEAIYAHNRDRLKTVQAARPARALEDQIRSMPPAPDFIAGLENARRPAPRLIAEVKRRSPSRGTLRADLDPIRLARVYAGSGASAISVLTEERYFGGALDDLRKIRSLETGLPLLRKDFIFDPYQLLEARASGASAALLIAAMLQDQELEALIRSAGDLGLAPLVEVHNESELDRALSAGASLVGINNRDLSDFSVDLGTCERLRPLIPPDIVVVAESGIHTTADVQRISALSIDAILVGEALVTAPDIAAQTAALAGLDRVRLGQTRQGDVQE